MNKLEITLAIVKPHAVKNVFALECIQKRISNEFRIIDRREITFTKEMAAKFYAEHRSKFFYNRLLSFITRIHEKNDYSGPSVAFILAAENAVTKWRKMMGPTKVFKAIYTDPDTIRGQFGLTDTRNACHGSDAEDTALAEINIIFPEFLADEWRKNQLIE